MRLGGRQGRGRRVYPRWEVQTRFAHTFKPSMPRGTNFEGELAQRGRSMCWPRSPSRSASAAETVDDARSRPRHEDACLGAVLYSRPLSDFRLGIGTARFTQGRAVMLKVTAPITAHGSSPGGRALVQCGPRVEAPLPGRAGRPLLIGESMYAEAR